jgi:hypothetical protein
MIIKLTSFGFLVFLSSYFVYNIDAEDKFEPQIIYLEQLPSLRFSDIDIDNKDNVYLFVYSSYTDEYPDISKSTVFNFTSNGKLTDKIPISDPIGTLSIAIDSKNNIYSLQRSTDHSSENYIHKYSNNEILNNTFGTFCEKYIPFPNKDECIDPDGIGNFELGDGQLYSPTKIRIDNNDNVYVLDEGNNRILKFLPNGSFISKVRIYCYEHLEIISYNNCINPINTTPLRPGPLKDLNGTFINPKDLFISNNYIYVLDNKYLLKYSPDFKFIKSWNFEKFFDKIYEFTSSVVVDNEENIYIYKAELYPSVYNKIVKFNKDGKYIYSINRENIIPYNFHSIIEMDIDSQNNLYVIDDTNSIILKFNKDGKLLQILRETLNKTSVLPFPDFTRYNSNNDELVINKFSNTVSKFVTNSEGVKSKELEIRPIGSFEIHTIDIDQKNDELYMYDNNLNVQVFNEDGIFLRGWNASEFT